MAEAKAGTRRPGVTTTWRWAHGTLMASAAPPVRREVIATIATCAALAILPLGLLLPPLLALVDASWASDTRSCIALRTAASCGRSYPQLAIGLAVLLGWLVLLAHATRSVVRRAREPQPVLSLDARGFVAPLSPPRKPLTSAEIPWDSVLAVRPTDDRRALEVEIRPGTGAWLTSGLQPSKNERVDSGTVRIRCGDGRADSAVLEHFSVRAARGALAYPTSAEDAERVARRVTDRHGEDHRHVDDEP